MFILDTRSVIFIAAVLALGCSAILLAMRRGFPASIGGVKEWSTGTVLIFIATMLLNGREHIPQWASLVLAHALLNYGLALHYAGLRHFYGLPYPRRFVLVVAAASVIVPGGIVVFEPDYTLRILGIIPFHIAIFLACFSRVAKDPAPSLASGFLSAIYLLAAFTGFVRILLVLMQEDKTSGLFDTNPVQRSYVTAFALAILLSTLGFLLLASDKLQALWRRIATIDPVCGAQTRGAILEQLERELERSRRHGHEVTILLMDLDHFKSVNDRFGHLVGDRTLADFALRCQDQLRNSDLLGRFGGEEFLAVLPETGGAEALQVAERVRATVATHDIMSGIPTYTVSIGVATARSGQTTEALLNEADQALYRAKAAGRNRVESGCVSLEESVPAAS